MVKMGGKKKTLSGLEDVRQLEHNTAGMDVKWYNHVRNQVS